MNYHNGISKTYADLCLGLWQVHPFNVEAPLSDLFNEGFLTSPELFYVRNHGPVPKVEDDAVPDWEFSVEVGDTGTEIPLHIGLWSIDWLIASWLFYLYPSHMMLESCRDW